MFSYYFIFEKNFLILYPGFSVGMDMDVAVYMEYTYPNLGTYTKLIGNYDVIVCGYLKFEKHWIKSLGFPLKSPYYYRNKATH